MRFIRIVCAAWLVACGDGSAPPNELSAGASAPADSAGTGAGMASVVDPSAGTGGLTPPPALPMGGMGGGVSPPSSGLLDAGAGEGGAGGSGASGGPSTGGMVASPPDASIPTGAPPTAASLLAAGPYTVQSYSIGFAVGPDFPGGTIWYPSDGEAPFASIAIVPGYLSPRVLIEGWGPFLASHGIVTFTIDTNTPGDQPDQRSRALLNALESLSAEHTRAASPLAGKLDNERQAVGGWSMGGGGTLITANTHPELKAAIAMCSWRPGGRFTTNRVPTLLFASAGDPLADGQSQGFYESIPDTTPKILFEWGVADHLLANAPTGAGGQVGSFALAWLKVFLEDDERYRPFIEVDCEGCTDFRSSL